MTQSSAIESRWAWLLYSTIIQGKIRYLTTKLSIVVRREVGEHEGALCSALEWESWRGVGRTGMGEGEGLGCGFAESCGFRGNDLIDSIASGRA